MTSYIGVDGCPAGWFAITLYESGSWRADLFPTIGKLWAECKQRDPALILIDIPIGLPENGGRLADAEARRVLGKRSSSVFSVPARAAIYAPAYAAANEINFQISGKRFSLQLWNIAPKIREMDALLQQDHEARLKFRETHPEILFWGLAEKPMDHIKKLNTGYQERITLLQSLFPDAPKVIAESRGTYRRLDVRRDDMVDALAAAVIAKQGNLIGLPATPQYDARGLPMQILYTTAPLILRLHHAQITVPSDQVEAARAFYSGLLGLGEIPKPDSLAGRGGFWLRVGEAELHVSPEDGVNREATKAHLAYQVANLAYWRKLLTDHGITIGDSIPIPGYQRFEFRDPFGNRVELIQKA